MTQARWWGQLPLEDGETRRRYIGPLEVLIQRCPGDLRLAAHEHNDAGMPAPMQELTVETSIPLSPEEVQALEWPTESRRYAYRPPLQGPLTLEPALADRPLVSRPETPLIIPAGEEVSFFVSSPLWLRVLHPRLGTLLDVPLRRPTDTWFGPDRRQGELCYASRTHPRIHRENLPVQMQRAVTPVRIINRATDALVLERLKVPVQHLEIFADDQGLLWTSAVELSRAEDEANEGDAVRFLPGAPPEVEGAERVAEARIAPETPHLLRALGFLFG